MRNFRDNYILNIAMRTSEKWYNHISDPRLLDHSTQSQVDNSTKTAQRELVKNLTPVMNKTDRHS